MTSSSDVVHSDLGKKGLQMSLTEFFAKLFVQLIAILIGFVPVWIGWAAFIILNPQDFWQTTALLAGLVLLFGWLQFWLFFTLLMVSFEIWEA